MAIWYLHVGPSASALRKGTGSETAPAPGHPCLQEADLVPPDWEGLAEAMSSSFMEVVKGPVPHVERAPSVAVGGTGRFRATLPSLGLIPLWFALCGVIAGCCSMSRRSASPLTTLWGLCAKTPYLHSRGRIPELVPGCTLHGRAAWHGNWQAGSQCSKQTTSTTHPVWLSSNKQLAHAGSS